MRAPEATMRRLGVTPARIPAVRLRLECQIPALSRRTMYTIGVTAIAEENVRTRPDHTIARPDLGYCAAPTAPIPARKRPTKNRSPDAIRYSGTVMVLTTP